MSNNFNKNVFKLLTGSTIAQAIPIVISPVLTRLYTPEDYGVLALFTAIVAVLGSVANARYDMAIVLPEEDKDSINVVALSILIAFSFSVLLLLLVLIFHNKITIALGNDEIGTWLYFIPLVVLFVGIFNALNYFNTRMKTYNIIAQVKVLKALSSASLQLGLGFLKAGVTGLISGHIISHIFANGRLAKSLVQNKNLLSEIKFSRMIELSKRYSNFFKYGMWATLANTMSVNLINIFLSLFYSAKALGHYNLVNRTLGMPTSIIGTSIGQVFFQQAAEEKNRTGRTNKIFTSTLKKLLIISVLPFLFLFLFSESLVTLIFGSDWSVAGQYMKILIPLFFIRFIMGPLSNILTIFEKQKALLYWQLGLLANSLLTFFIAYLLKLNVEQFLIIYTCIQSVHYLIMFIIVYKLSYYGAVK